MRITVGVIIAIALIVYWYTKDHPNALPAKTGMEQHAVMRAV